MFVPKSIFQLIKLGKQMNIQSKSMCKQMHIAVTEMGDPTNTHYFVILIIESLCFASASRLVMLSLQYL